MSDKELEIVADCGYIKGYALIIGQALRGDFEGEIRGFPGVDDNPSLDALKGYAQQMKNLATKVADYIGAK